MALFRGISSTARPRVPVFGHSFVRRLREFLVTSQHDETFDSDLNLSLECEVTMRGKDGHTVDKMVRFDFGYIRNCAPDIMILEMGSNDLCDVTCDTETVALSIEALVELMHAHLQVKFIMVCEIIPREKPPFLSYNERVADVNNLLKTSLVSKPFAGFWHHHGLSNPTVDIYAPDGIHLHSLGNKVLYCSYRGQFWSLHVANCSAVKA